MGRAGMGDRVLPWELSPTNLHTYKFHQEWGWSDPPTHTPTQMCRCPRNFPACPFLSPEDSRAQGAEEAQPQQRKPP